jgi:GTP cyclohydrolase I
MKPVDRAAAARAIQAFLEALGHDPKSPLLRETPERVAEAFADDLLSGERVDVAALLLAGSEPVSGGGNGLVAVREIPITAVCPHHLLPAVGHATVAYVPGRRLLGLGTVARLADACSRRLALQEAVGEAIVDALIEHAGARGAFCRLELLHTCLSARGAAKPETRLVTLAQRGVLAGSEALQALGLALGSVSL